VAARIGARRRVGPLACRGTAGRRRFS
jgi:hypothetical protein